MLSYADAAFDAYARFFRLRLHDADVAYRHATAPAAAATLMRMDRRRRARAESRVPVLRVY